jgi:hypothetical protein
MKRVTLLDDGVGNALGWNPDGVFTSFTISEPNTFGDSSIVTASVCSAIFCGGTVFPCFVSPRFQGTFLVSCQVAPTNGAELHYEVTRLSPHIGG